MGTLCANGTACLINGPPCSGKSSLMSYVSASIAKCENVSSAKLALSSASDPH